MIVRRAPHRWTLSPAAAIRVQARLAQRVEIVAGPISARRIAGGDVAFSPDGQTLIAGWVVWDRLDHAVVESVHVAARVRFPYVPGLLSFRETPALLAAARRIRTPPDAVLVDGQGVAHPRRFGLACHLGMLLDCPTVGCGKSRLCGEFAMPAARRGSWSELFDGPELIGRAVQTRDGAAPIFISIGFRCDLPGATRLVLDCGAGYRVPEPTRLAHQLVTQLARQRWGAAGPRAATTAAPAAGRTR